MRSAGPRGPRAAAARVAGRLSSDECDVVGGLLQNERMIDHFGINCADLASAAAFYDRVLGALGHRRIMDFGVAIGYGSDKPEFWISAQPPQGPASGPNREVHIAFTAPDAETVQAFFTAATEAGADVLHEPRLWPEYHERYFGAFVRDPDGNNVEAVCHTAGSTG
jgi:catechol 2,3-dioxygenase-like lactoylglutathione lyase family enzyme